MSEMKLTNPAVVKVEEGTVVKVYKHGLATRIMHGICAVCCVCLIVTGCMLLFGFKAGSEMVALIHCMLGLVFVVAPLVWAITNWKEFCAFISNIFHYDKDDAGWIKAPMGGYLDAFIGRKDNPSYVPPQGKYNTGQKLAGVFLMLGGLALGMTGLIMWAASGNGIFGLHIDVAPQAVMILWRIHLVVAILMTLLVCVHFVMGAILPATRVEFTTMFGDGYADMDYCVKKHGKWLESMKVDEELTAKENAGK